MTGDSFLAHFSFKGRQEQAATDPHPAIAVTAGAGSGKTLSLVGRYLCLLERGYPLRSLVAITFTEKAAREMRNRIHQALSRLQETSGPQALAAGELARQMEAARISTIHSLCAEILRAHPAEAGLDPQFVVLEEGLAAASRAQAVESALAWAAADAQAAGLFAIFREGELRRILASLLGQGDILPTNVGGDALPGNQGGAWESLVADYLAAWLESSACLSAIDILRMLKSSDPADKLELARCEVLAHWDFVQAARSQRSWDEALVSLAALRKATSIQGRKGSWSGDDLEDARQSMVELRQVYDEHLKSLAEKGRWALDVQTSALLPSLFAALDRARGEYQRLKDEQQALDFDDLEGRTAWLLSNSLLVRTRWQREVRAVLVDEFQDTNERQRQIVYALAGFDPQAGAAQADLFIVGDAKQSIYKFRGADVTVFRQVQQDIRAANGLPIDLDLTFRAHKPLLDALNALLSPVMGDGGEAQRPYYVPFTPLNANRKYPKNAQPPFIEIQLGLGDDAEHGRAASAAALARRLHELRQSEGFEWGQMALLFRSSSTYGIYEAALERAEVPFVTIAGRGFYDRPEIRDLLNVLTAIADPTDDLALAGLLRSPAFGLVDAELYRLRFSRADGSKQPLWDALRSAATSQAERAVRILDELTALAGRATVAAVLKRFLDLTFYRAILSTLSEGSRMLRNVDKLLADAHRSRLVGIGEFLTYVQTLRDVGLREGEAPVDAGGAVQLMTVHKAKGLEFPLVVLADAAYENRGVSGRVLRHAQAGLLIDLRDVGGELHPLAWQIASLEEIDKDDAEDRRLLYVACTRAKEKLIVNGHAKILKAGTLGLKGWLKRLGDVLGLGEIAIEGDLAALQPLRLKLPAFDGAEIACTLHSAVPAEEEAAPVFQPASLEPAVTVLPDLVTSALQVAPEVVDEKIREREVDPPQRVWRVVPHARHPVGPAWVVGQLVHQALRHWRFPGEGFDNFIRPFALQSGLTDPAEIHATILEVRRLMARFRDHPLCAEIEAAVRYHEVPYVSPKDAGIVDLLYRTPQGGWCIVDFKTDQVRSPEEAWRSIRDAGYDRQVERYASALQAQIGQVPEMRLVFLQVGKDVGVFNLEQED